MEIQDYPDYLIYDDGLLFSEKNNKFLKPGKNNSGYEHVNLSKNGKRKDFLIHRLVGLHYIPLVEGKDYVDHIDGNKLNNNVSNLRWVTRNENNNNFRPIQKNNKLGHKNIVKRKNGFQFSKIIYGKLYSKYHKNLNELLWFKFSYLLLHNQ